MAKEAQISSAKVTKLLAKGVIAKATHDVDEFISTIFTRPIRDATHRLILNFKKLNDHMVYHHFKSPLKYLLMPLLGKNRLAITLHLYASVGPNSDNTHRRPIWSSS